MTYETPEALRIALETRLLARSNETGIGLDRLRRRVLFERIIARLEAADPGRWVLKGGMALEVRIQDAARLTKDIDLGLRDEVANGTELHERLVDALTADPDGDNFVFTTEPPVRLSEDGSVTWRSKVAAQLSGRLFGGIQLDISPRPHELDATERMELPNSMDFAGIPATVVEIVDVHRHAAEKFHGMLRDFGNHENSRVRDLVDLVILIEEELVTASALAAKSAEVWNQRDGVDPPITLPVLPETWPSRYEKLAADLDLDTKSFSAAVALVDVLWAEMFPIKEV